MYDPQEKAMVPVPADETTLTPEQRTWTRFEEGEKLSVKGVPMYVHEIGEKRLVLKFAILLLTLGIAPLTLHAQTAEPPTSTGPAAHITPGGAPPDAAALKQQVADLEDQLAERDIVISNLRMMLLQNQATPVATQRNEAVKTLEARHPGMHWDDAQQKLVPTPAPAPAPAPKPAARK